MKMIISNLVDKHKKIMAWSLLILMCFIAYFLTSNRLNFVNLMLVTPSGAQQTLKSPEFMESKETGTYTLKGSFTKNSFFRGMVRIIPDDQIENLKINSRSVDLMSVSEQQRRDYFKGFEIDLSDYLQEGVNQIEIEYYDRGGLMGIVVEPLFSFGQKSIFNTMLFLVVLIASYLCLVSFSKSFSQSRTIQILFLLAVIIRLVYFFSTPPDVRDHDLGDHFDYVEYMSEHWFPPSIERATGGAYFHPPLYYYTGAMVYKAAGVYLGDSRYAIASVLQLLSLLYSLGFVYFGLLTLKEIVYRFFDTDVDARKVDNIFLGKIFFVAGLMLALWPSSVIHSVRIGNDPLLYFLYAVSLFKIVQWYFYDQKKDLLVASIFGALAILAKANGEVLIAVIFFVGLYKLWKSRDWNRYFRISILPATILIIALGVTVAPGLILKLQGKRDNLYIDDISGLSQANIVGNTASNYFWFDAKIFITEPFTSPYDDRYGRQYFWNYLAKTGLFGEFSYPKLININLAVISSFLFVCMAIYTLAGIYLMTRADIRKQAVLILSAFFLVAGVTYMRITFPANIDFRYIVPVITTFCCLFAVSLVCFLRVGAKKMVAIGKFLSISFSICSAIFILGLSL
jgi:hypothetical protein